MKWIVLLIGALIVLVAAWVAISGRKTHADGTDSYVCDTCGESDCECRKESQ